MKMLNKAIGVFDSGLGGLTAVKEIQHLLPHEDIIYFGDTGRVPYGNKSRETIIKYANQDVAFLKSRGVKFIIAACGTASSVAENLGNELNVAFTGVVKPTAIAAYNATKNKKIGVIGTTATITSKSYRNVLESIDKNIEVFEQDCPLFVPLVENGFISSKDPLVLMVIERYLSELKKFDIDTLILGCTHYPILSEAIKLVIGDKIQLIDSGKETAKYARDFLKEKYLVNNREENGKCSFFVSDTIDNFKNIANVFLNEKINYNIEQIDIEQY